MPKVVRTGSKKVVKKAAVKHDKKGSLSKKIVQKKPYVELITAILSIPVLITLSILNINSLAHLNAGPTPTPQQFRNGGGFFAAPVGVTKISPSLAQEISQGPCIQALGPLDITYPGENDTITQNPITIAINYDDSKHCGAVWSYRINGGSWSGYDDRSVALYNLPRGQVTFELRAKSIVTTEEKNLSRKFIYKGEGIVFPSDNTGTESAN